MRLDKGIILGIVGTVLLTVGVFLPWATASSPGGNLENGATYGSTSGWDNYSVYDYEYFLVKIAMVLSVIGMIMIAIKRRLTIVAGLIIGVSTLVILLYTYANLEHTAYLINIQHISDWSAGVGYGIWVSIIGSLLLITGGVLAFKETKKITLAQITPSETQQSPQ